MFNTSCPFLSCVASKQTKWLRARIDRASGTKDVCRAYLHSRRSLSQSHSRFLLTVSELEMYDNHLISHFKLYKIMALIENNVRMFLQYNDTI